MVWGPLLCDDVSAWTDGGRRGGTPGLLVDGFFVSDCGVAACTGPFKIKSVGCLVPEAGELTRRPLRRGKRRCWKHITLTGQTTHGSQMQLSKWTSLPPLVLTWLSGNSRRDGWCGGGGGRGCRAGHVVPEAQRPCRAHGGRDEWHHWPYHTQHQDRYRKGYEAA